MDSGQFSWKPSLWAREVRLTIDKSGFYVERGDRQRRVDFASISEIYYKMTRNRGVVIHTLSFVLLDGDEIVLRISTYVRGKKAFQDFAAAVATLLRASAQVNPALTVRRGYAPRYRRRMAILLFGILFAGTGFVFASDQMTLTAMSATSFAFVFAVFLAIVWFSVLRVSGGPGESPNALAAELEEKAARGGR